MDHPRGCGENRSTSDSCNSSIRITPADAGKTQPAFAAEDFGRDHPRGCGENQHGARVRQAADRITPADAGKTQSQRTRRRSHWDHPRGCGENTGLVMSGCAYPGSPPRMRGKLFKGVSLLYVLRITPADAGKTRCWAASRVSLRDHPRGCGENFADCSRVSAFLGSPPRMRGKRQTSQGRMP